MLRLKLRKSCTLTAEGRGFVFLSAALDSEAAHDDLHERPCTRSR